MEERRKAAELKKREELLEVLAESK